ncbi:MAG: ABC transporter permease [Defluviitaleaceae bacterium]|nr:ABC transporter permease [Defluviitaleaceae bacterium]MCL2275361.1 ABC transporter permease [Defluviitaleaceae bacterium]
MTVLKLVWKNLLRRRGRFAFTLLGITIGMAAFVALLSMGDNLRAEVTHQADALGANLIVMARADCPFINLSVLTGDHLPEAIPREIVFEIAAIEGVTGAVPYLTVGSSIRQVPVSLVGILPAEMKRHRGWDVHAGAYFSHQEAREVVLGYALAGRFELETGDTVTLRGEEIPIAGILSATNSNDDITMFMPLCITQEIFGLGDYVSFIAVTVADVTNIDRYISAITDIANLSVSTNEELLGSVLLILGSLNVTLQAIASVALIAAAFGIINTMMTATYERRREIGILRAMGSRSGIIFRIFVLESGLYGLLGGLLGFFVGFGVSRIAAPVISRNEFVAVVGTPDTAVAFSVTLLAGVVALSVVIAVAAGLYPAWKAAKLTPMEAIRNG